MEYPAHLLVLISIFSMLTLSLDLILGYAGILSIAHIAFFGVGAYATAIMTTAGVAWPLALITGASIAAALALLLALLSLRLSDDYFVIATFGFQVVLVNVLNNWSSLTRGPLGITGIPRPTVFGITVSTTLEFAALAASCAAVTFAVVRYLTGGTFGRWLRAMNDDELFVLSVGANPVLLKTRAFVAAACIASVSGSLYAHYVSFIDPTSVSVLQSILLISMVVVGGAASAPGAIAGALLLVLFPEVLRFLGLPSALAANVRQILYGALLVAILATRPAGLLGRVKFGRTA